MRQVTGYKKTFGAGFPHQIHGQIIILLEKRIIMVLPHGLLKVKSSGNGNRQAVSYGSMAFVGELPPYILSSLRSFFP
jgi:hypothetical protein